MRSRVQVRPTDKKGERVGLAPLLTPLLTRRPVRRAWAFYIRTPDSPDAETSKPIHMPVTAWAGIMQTRA